MSGLLYPSPRQSLELKTGVINQSLGLLITARLHTRSPAADSALTTPPSPHTPTARLRPGSRPACSPPPIPGEEVGYRHLCAHGLWTTLNLKGCKARYQRVIRALVSFMRWSHWRGAWSEQRVNFPSQEVVTEGEDGPTNGQTTPFNGAVSSLSV